MLCAEWYTSVDSRRRTEVEGLFGHRLQGLRLYYCRDSIVLLFEIYLPSDRLWSAAVGFIYYLPSDRLWSAAQPPQILRVRGGGAVGGSGDPRVERA
eukprot:732245-Pyramimonas_sp.AAC.1